MAFKPIIQEAGNTVLMKMASSVTVSIGSALAFASGYVTPAISTTNEVLYISLEEKTSGGAENPEILCLRVNPSMVFTVNTTGNMSQAYVGTKADLTDDLNLNEDAVTRKVFFIEGFKGATTDKIAIGRFVQKDDIDT